MFTKKNPLKTSLEGANTWSKLWDALLRWHRQQPGLCGREADIVDLYVKRLMIEYHEYTESLPKAPTIWSSIEFDAISKDFSYGEYRRFHTHAKCKGSQVSRAAYLKLADAFYQDMMDKGQ